MPPVPTIVAMFPPEDADQLVARWKELGCPRIRLEGGLIIMHLERWFYPVGKPDRPYDVLAAVRRFLQMEWPGSGY